MIQSNLDVISDCLSLTTHVFAELYHITSFSLIFLLSSLQVLIHSAWGQFSCKPQAIEIVLLNGIMTPSREVLGYTSVFIFSITYRVPMLLFCVCYYNIYVFFAEVENKLKVAQEISEHFEVSAHLIIYSLLYSSKAGFPKSQVIYSPCNNFIQPAVSPKQL